MKTKVNKIPLVGPKGRKELLKRINELEAQIAQQDYLKVNIENSELELTNSEKLKIKTLHEQGLLFDTVLVTGNGSIQLRIIADMIDNNETIAAFDYVDSMIKVVDCSIV